MFDGFTQTQMQTSDPQVAIHLCYGGHGPPLLLLHGNPLTHVHWHFVAPRLAKDCTVVAADLRGYGDSGKPRGLPDQSHYSFRRMARDQVEVMAALGFDQFFAGRMGRSESHRKDVRLTRGLAAICAVSAPVLPVAMWALPRRAGSRGDVYGP